MTSSTAQVPSRGRRLRWAVAVVLILLVGIFAWHRVGVLDLPAVPGSLTLDATGLAGLREMKQLNDQIWSDSVSAPNAPRSTLRAPPALSDAASLVQRGLAAHRRGDTTTALETMRQGIRL